MTPKPKRIRSHGTTGTTHSSFKAGASIKSAQGALRGLLQKGRPGNTTPGLNLKPQPQPATFRSPLLPPPPPKPGDIMHTAGSAKHITTGDGNNTRQGGHLAGTGFTDKTEFPKGWDEPKILDAAYRVTQQGPPIRGPYKNKKLDGTKMVAYDYEGQVDGITIKTTVMADGEIRTAYPPNRTDPGVIYNPELPTGLSRPNHAPNTPTRYSNPAVGGDGTWYWEGKKGNQIIRVTMDANGNVTPPPPPPKPKK